MRADTLGYFLVLGGDWEEVGGGDYSSIYVETGKLGGSGWPTGRKTLADEAAKPGLGGGCSVSGLESL